MMFYDSIYATAYKTYNRYEKGPRLKAASFVFMHMLGGISIIILAVRNIFGLDFTGAKTNASFNLIVLLTVFFLLGILWKYYSTKRVENILIEFDKKDIGIRKLWGYIAVITFILQFCIFIYLL